MLAFRKFLKDEKGSIMVETVLSCLLLLIFFYGFLEMFYMIQSDRYAIIIAREGAREAGLTSSIDIGRAKANDLAQQYYGTLAADTTIVFQLYGATSVRCTVTHEYKPFKRFTESDGRGVVLHGSAIFPYR